jgi:hypothetical protein
MRVRAGLQNARAEGKRLGRPRVAVDAAQIARLRAPGRPGRRSPPSLGSTSARCSRRAVAFQKIRPRRILVRLLWYCGTDSDGLQVGRDVDLSAAYFDFSLPGFVSVLGDEDRVISGGDTDG